MACRSRFVEPQSDSGAVPRFEICWMAQALPSGSVKKTKPTFSSGCGVGIGDSSRTWMGLTSTPRSVSSLWARMMSDTTSCRPLTEPGVMFGRTAPMTIEQPDPGGVSCKSRDPGHALPRGRPYAYRCGRVLIRGVPRGWWPGVAMG